MLSRRRPLGYTLAELIVAMVIGGIVLALLTAIAARQYRALADLADYAALGQQIQDARTILPSQLRGLSPLGGDIRDARDTAIEFRSTIAAAVICDTSANTVVLSPASANAPPLAAISQTLEAGDSAWIFAPGDSIETWMPARITHVATSAGRPCAPLGPALDQSQRAQPRLALTLSTSPRVSAGIPILITRRVRYSLYRASDGLWYLGQRDWNNAGGYLNIVQPIAGPFLSPAQNGLRFTYLDTNGAAMNSPVADPRAIGAIQLEVRGQTRNPARTLAAAGDRSRRPDSATALISLRNR
jgi:prepilin-type N-terminal cleavage/methylation domain-containing protein